ncbi:MAG: hypothetical protein Q7J14_02145 [Candidatus Magasanikbacteria bacterium]|nr:hypothetical protein [Candidatus Magasanikbacteria bacterium]
MEEENNSAPVINPEPQIINPEPQPQTQNTGSDVGSGKVCAVLSYLLVGIIWYFVDENMKKNTFAKFHVKQSLVLLVVSLILQTVGTVLPVIGWFLILPLAGIFSLILMLIGIINALNGKTKELPIIGKYSTKFNF